MSLIHDCCGGEIVGVMLEHYEMFHEDENGMIDYGKFGCYLSECLNTCIDHHSRTYYRKLTLQISPDQEPVTFSIWELIRLTFESMGVESVDLHCKWIYKWALRFIYAIEYSDHFTWDQYLSSDPNSLKRTKEEEIEHKEKEFKDVIQIQLITCCVKDLIEHLKGGDK